MRNLLLIISALWSKPILITIIVSITLIVITDILIDWFNKRGD